MFGKRDLLACCGQFERLRMRLLLGMRNCSCRDLNLLRLETKLSIIDGPSTLVVLIDWLGCM